MVHSNYERIILLAAVLRIRIRIEGKKVAENAPKLRNLRKNLTPWIQLRIEANADPYLLKLRI